MAAEKPPTEELRAGNYEKSSFSPDQQNCVMLSAQGNWIGMQDSKEYPSTPKPARTTLGFTREEFAAFLAGAKAGEFDHLA